MAFRSKIELSSARGEEDTDRRKIQKTQLLIKELKKMEEEYESFEIQVAMRRNKIGANYTSGFDQIHNEVKFIHEMYNSLNLKYENSEFNTFRKAMTKSKQTAENMILNLFYSLFKRLFESERSSLQRLQSYYSRIIEEK